MRDCRRAAVPSGSAHARDASIQDGDVTAGHDFGRRQFSKSLHDVSCFGDAMPDAHFITGTYGHRY